MLSREVMQMNNGYYALFMQTGDPAFYVLAKQTDGPHPVRPDPQG